MRQYAMCFWLHWGGRGQARTKREGERRRKKKKKEKKKKKRKDVGIDVPIRRVWMGKTVCSVRNVIANVMVVLVPKHKRKEIRQQHLLTGLDLNCENKSPVGKLISSYEATRTLYS